MIQQIFDILKNNILITIGPVVGIVVGAFLGSIFHPDKKTLSILRNLAAGLVLAALSIELTPKVTGAESWKSKIAILSGIVIGALMMILIRTFSAKKDDKAEILASIGTDFFIDALLIGIAIGVISGGKSKGGIIMALALGLEMFILTMSTVAGFKSNALHAIMVAGIFTLSVLAGIFFGIFAASNFQSSFVICGMLAAGLSVLIWLVCEDLIAKNDPKILDSRIGATMLFLGFMLVVVMEWFE